LGQDLIIKVQVFNPLNAELNPICHLLALLGGATIVVVSRLRVKGVQNFRHLGALINSEKVISHEIKSKIAASNR